jgi:LAO/AO transport system kinase
MARAFDVCEFDVLLIETVGVGQTELDVLHVADKVCVVLVPESGDAIQTMKAGLMEIADVFVVNKSDRPGADGLAREIQASQHDSATKESVEVLQTIATEGKGADELTELVLKLKNGLDLKHSRDLPARLKEEAKALLRRELEAELQSKVKDLKSPSDMIALFSK